MILTGPAIEEAIAAGDIVFDPFTRARVNPNSIDLHLGDDLRRVVRNADGAAMPSEPLGLPPEGRYLEPGQLYLIHSLERFGSTRFAPFVHGKSTIARAGLFVHANGEMIDVGEIARYEFQLYPVMPIKLTPGMAIAQVTFWVMQP